MITNDRRPLNFEAVYPTCDIKGFEKDLADNKFPNVSMFWGKPGLGKTTMARIIAAHLLGVSENDAKQIITRGPLASVPGFHEFDFALKGKAHDIEQVAEKLYEAKIDSLLGRPAVFILDEFTEASGGKDKTESTQKKLSKSLEDAIEGPFYVIFITNDLHKVEESIHSRAEEYEFKELNYDFCMKFFDDNAKAINGSVIPSKIKEELYNAVEIKAPRKLLITLNQYLHRGIIAGSTSEDVATIREWLNAVNSLAKTMGTDAENASAAQLHAVISKLLMVRPTYDQCIMALCKYYDVTVREPANRTLGSFAFISGLIDAMNDQGEHYGPVYSYPLLGLMRFSYKWAQLRRSLVKE